MTAANLSILFLFLVLHHHLFLLLSALLPLLVRPILLLVLVPVLIIVILLVLWLVPVPFQVPTSQFPPRITSFSCHLSLGSPSAAMSLSRQNGEQQF